MRRLAIGVILVALNWTAVLAQQNDKASKTPTTPTTPGPAVSLAPDIPETPAFNRATRDFTFPQSQTSNPATQAADRLTNPENPFVIVGGALYIRLPVGDFLMPVSGGGASGCFSVDLPRRIRILDEFVPRLNILPRN